MTNRPGVCCVAYRKGRRIVRRRVAQDTFWVPSVDHVVRIFTPCHCKSGHLETRFVHLLRDGGRIAVASRLYGSARVASNLAGVWSLHRKSFNQNLLQPFVLPHTHLYGHANIPRGAWGP